MCQRCVICRGALLPLFRMHALEMCVYVHHMVPGCSSSCLWLVLSVASIPDWPKVSMNKPVATGLTPFLLVLVLGHLYPFLGPFLSDQMGLSENRTPPKSLSFSLLQLRVTRCPQVLPHHHLWTPSIIGSTGRRGKTHMEPASQQPVTLQLDMNGVTMRTGPNRAYQCL
jgi:hypothetical protein